MEPLFVHHLCKLFNGRILFGNDDWSIHHAIFHKRHKLEHTHTMIFLGRRQKIYWGHISKFTPCLVVTDKKEEDIKKFYPGVTIIQVNNLVHAHWKFTNYYRNLFQIPVVAITGTCGKSTTKEMIKHILQKDHHVQATESSKNEPRRSFPYLMGITKQTDMAVFELGLGNTGNIKHQCNLFKPTIGIITNIREHHLDGCNSIEGYIQAKGEIIDGITQPGILLLNADDQNTKKLPISNFKGNVFYIGVQQPSDYHAKNIVYAVNGMMFDFELNHRQFHAFVPGYGEHQVYNALFSIACAHLLGIGIDTAIEQLKSFRNMARHLEISHGINGSTIIDDTWTINPLSIEAALQVIENLGKHKRKIVLLGNIYRLGTYEEEYHRKVGSAVSEYTVDYLITIGDKAQFISSQAIEDGFKGSVNHFETTEGVFEQLVSLLNEDTILLIKGPMKSKSMIELAQKLKEPN
ncbi:UDP-N-acetylmuramoyl-tripeptide--D-alanyl-D-alanine ligase [Bacillus carboniphilus]|uniref:UDP-N-acetylmuramoyl-tripeptide--D-alanyl-D-alanine ligase n=1 Tax=Bacillus carboniphilus TaxID=86663 RepID=A0ABY9JXR8_9BACI|nr:UDP-N-acetylmuramoyl-tripeptide--D-alanyl-D-alanine ligase [Bacillus carboniphilus]WLR43128.1 UDP-N-acetylmuramoyl-tripeptide--D-alanyl-D-alanine ligase [Bacillus carboniphilus]